MSLSVSLPYSDSDAIEDSEAEVGLEAHTDAQLMSRVHAGDREAFGDLVMRHKDSLVGYLTRLTADRSRAEDLAQEAFLRLYRAASSYREQGHLTAYLFRIATNLLRSEERKSRRWNLLTPRLVAEGPTGPASPHAEFVSRETSRHLERALAELPLKFRVPLVLYEIEGCSYRTIADVLSCNEGTVKSRIARARARLREKLAPIWNGGIR